MKLFKYKEYNSNNTNSNITYKYLILSLFSVVICASLLCLTSYAWFTSTTSTSVSSVISPTYKLSYKVIKTDGSESDSIELSYDSDSYTKYDAQTANNETTEDSITITLTATGTNNATGYCVIKVGDKTYYTDQIIVDNDIDTDSSYTFSLDNVSGKTITFIPYWGHMPSTISGTKIENNPPSTATSLYSFEEEAIAATSAFEDDIDAATNTETEITGEVTPSDNNTSNESDNDSIENNSEESTGDINSGTPTSDVTNTDVDASDDSPTTDSQELTNDEQSKINETKQSNDVSIEVDVSSGE